jgi:hypothetical protein
VHAKVKYINLLLIVYGFAQSTFPILPSNIAFKLGLFMRQMLRVLVSDCVLSAHIRRDPVPEPTVPILWFRSLGSLPLVTTPYWRQETRALNACFLSRKSLFMSLRQHTYHENDLECSSTGLPKTPSCTRMVYVVTSVPLTGSSFAIHGSGGWRNLLEI